MGVTHETVELMIRGKRGPSGSDFGMSEVATVVREHGIPNIRLPLAQSRIFRERSVIEKSFRDYFH